MTSLLFTVCAPRHALFCLLPQLTLFNQTFKNAYKPFDPNTRRAALNLVDVVPDTKYHEFVGWTIAKYESCKAKGLHLLNTLEMTDTDALTLREERVDYTK